MKEITRITFDPEIMGGKPCIRGMRVTVGTIVGLIASGHSKKEIIELYPYLEAEDIDEAPPMLPGGLKKSTSLLYRHPGEAYR